MEASEQARERIIDEEHLRLLAIGHYINGGLWIAFVFIVTYAGRASRMTWSVYPFLFVAAIAAPIAHWAIVLTRSSARARSSRA